MAIEIVMPRLGLLMEEGTIIEWKKKDGDEVRSGEVIFILEYEKTTEDIRSPADGVLHLAADITQGPMPVGTILGYIIAPGERLPLDQNR